jgi:hypothetical protein
MFLKLTDDGRGIPVPVFCKDIEYETFIPWDWFNPRLEEE